MPVSKFVRDTALAAARWQAQTLAIRGTGRVVKSLYPHPRPADDYIERVLPYENGVIQVDTRSYIEWSIYTYGVYDRASVELMKRLAHPGSVVMDVGANVGVITLPLARAVGPSGKVYAFEPHPLVRKRLKENIALNNLRNVHVMSDALGPAEGTATLNSNSTGNDGAGSLARSPGQTGAAFDVQIRTLDSQTADFSRLDLIKIDVEGADYGVLEGARATIERFKPPVYIEVEPELLAFFGRGSADIFAYFQSYGYEIWRNETRENEPYPCRLSRVTSPEVPRPENWLAVHP